MKKLKLLCLIAIGLMAIGSSCEREEPNPDEDICYEGIILDIYCSSSYTIQVEQYQIGEKWVSNSGDTFNNVITIRNVPNFEFNAKLGDKIYFKIDVESSKSSQQCVNEMLFCTQDRVPNLSNRKFCIKSISTQKCNDN
jgi:hypothetical protein